MNEHDRSRSVDIACTFLRETPRAYLIQDGDEEVWVPKSQCTEVKIDKDNNMLFEVPEWLAYEKGLI